MNDCALNARTAAGFFAFVVLHLLADNQAPELRRFEQVRAAFDADGPVRPDDGHALPSWRYL